MAAEEKWYFTREQLANTPSRKSGYDADKELSCRQQAANFIQDMGQRLLVNQLCINTAIVYMHRFYMFHSFTRFHRNAMAAAALFLAAKVEEQPRKLEHVIKVAQICLHREQPPPDVKSEVYLEQAQELVVNENILLQTLGFDVAIDHPHTHVVRCCHLVRASKDLAQTSYFMASNSLHLTTMCLQYKPTVVACFCIHLACKWSNWEIPQSTEGKPWFWYVDKSVTQELLEQLTEEFLAIFEKCPSRLKKKITSLSSNQNQAILSAFNSENEKKRNGEGTSSNPSTTAINYGGSDDMKKKQEYLRHHPDFKKHHIPHHARSDGHMSKSSCMFGPPTRCLPSGHANNSNSSGSGNNPVLRPVPSSKQAPGEPVSLLGKPEHLHHRPRRPDEKHSRNHELISSQYKKYDKVSSAVISDFMPMNVGSNNSNSSSSNNNINSNSSSNNNRINMGANSNNYLNVPLSHVQQSSSNVYLHQQQQQQQSQPQIPSQNTSVSHTQSQNIEMLNRMVVADPISSNTSGGQPTSHTLPSSLNKHQLFPPTTTTALPHTSTANTRVKSPGLLPHPIKVERSIFSPEKSTPPSESSTKPARCSSQSPSSITTIVTAVPHIGTSTTITTASQSTSVAASLPTVLRKKSEPVADPQTITSHSKAESYMQNQAHSIAFGEPVKSEVFSKYDKPPDVSKHNEGNISLNTSETLVDQPFISLPASLAVSQSDEIHSKEPKKKKKKHKEHKDKHKDKHKHTHKNVEPIVITIPKKKLSLPEQGLLKIKIPKDKIAPTGLKIKIHKEKIKESRKRERSEEKLSGISSKIHRPNGTTVQMGMEQSGQH